MNGNNIRVGSLFGIPFYLNPSWFFVLGLVTLTYGGQLAGFEQLTGLLPWVLGLVTAILIFASVLAHELGHSFAAIAQGIEVKSITLFLFGGVASLGKESKTPWESLVVAIAGPGVSLLLFALFSLISTQMLLPAPVQAIVFLLATINLVLAVFNMIPGLPLDGGNVLKSIVWQITGDANRGILVASQAGQFFGWLAIAVGILATLGISPVGSIWTALIGWFILRNASASAASAKIQGRLNKFTAADAVLPNSPIVPEDLTLREFANNYVIGQTSWMRFLVTNLQGDLVGAIDVNDLKKIPTSDWNSVQVRDILSPVGDMETVQADQSLLDVAKILEQKQLKEVLVQNNGKLLGLIEKTAIISLLQKTKA
ncbi:site-2 protease family protein [Gloeocapsa sp. PCC 73106]|uniref:site-2 protease family protein n=1 Tax=Gloeocapsa sp. PCC 73106 TaxID=102232 RepID=UPI0002ABFB3F|nr:site-2 protease family protein [Gloeocapsa sp. PCC 73106]ELR99026.1 Zn-dependent protease [Gloeocapsa sp. PCC 73106]